MTLGSLPPELGTGASGFHGEAAVRVRQVLQAATDLVTNFNALLAKLDADAGVTDTDYVSTLEIT